MLHPISSKPAAAEPANRGSDVFLRLLPLFGSPPATWFGPRVVENHWGFSSCCGESFPRQRVIEGAAEE